MAVGSRSGVAYETDEGAVTFPRLAFPKDDDDS